MIEIVVGQKWSSVNDSDPHYVTVTEYSKDKVSYSIDFINKKKEKDSRSYKWDLGDVKFKESLNKAYVLISEKHNRRKLKL